jgi:hypothetical protein
MRRPRGSLGLDLDRIAMGWLMLPGLRGRIAELASEQSPALSRPSRDGGPLCHARTGPPGVDSLTIRQSMRLERRGSRKLIVHAQRE